MKKKTYELSFILCFGILFLISLANAWSNTTFNNSLTSENLTFTTNQNITRWLQVPQNTYLIKGSLNLSGYNSTGGEISFNGNCMYGGWKTVCYCMPDRADCTPPVNGNDSNWDTAITGSDYVKVIYNYSYYGSEEQLNFYWKGDTSSSGWSMFLWNFTSSSWVSYTTCQDAGGEGDLGTRHNCYFNHSSYGITNEVLVNISLMGGGNNAWYYEGILLPRATINSSLSINNNKVWNYTGNFSGINKTSNTASFINTYLSSCSFVSGYCYVPFIFHSDTAGILQYSAMSFDDNLPNGFVENSQTYSASTYETATESFILNMSYSSNNWLMSAASLYYNGTAYTGKKTGSGNNLLFTRSLAVPEVNATTNYTFYWSVALTNSTGTFYFNSTSYNQTVNNIGFTLCDGTPGETPYLNFTFKNESDGVIMSALNDLTDVSYGYSGIVETNSYITSNSTANPYYAFCVTPNSTSVYVDLIFKYSNSGFPLRTFRYYDQLLTNVTTNQVLYLLPSSAGIYSSFQVVESSLAPIQSAQITVERQFSGVWEIIGQEITGSDGVTTFWVNPNFEHRISVSKDGYVATQVTITPSQSIYTITLQKSSSGNATYVSDIEGVEWVVYPKVGELANGTITFNATVTSSNSNLENCKFELLNGSNTSQVLAYSISITNSSYCFLTFDYVVTPNIKLFGRLSLDTTSTDGYVIIDTDWKWITYDLGGRKPWSTIKSFFADLTTIGEFGEGNEAEFSRLIVFFIIATIGIGVLTYFTGIELSTPGYAILIVWGLALFASAGGFLTFESASTHISSKLEQWGLFLIATVFLISYFLNNLRREQE